MIRLDPSTFGLEGFLEKSLYYMELYSRELEYMGINNYPIEEQLVIYNVIQDLATRLSVVFDEKWYNDIE